MNGEIEIDVIIPSYRLDLNFILPILNLKIPKQTTIRFTIIIDNPKIEIPQKLINHKQKNLQIIRNKSNLGASKTRNKGIDSTTYEYILFLDDDIIPNDDLLFHYVKEIQSNDNTSNKIIGYSGLIKFPNPTNSFTKGVIASDILTFFSISNWMDRISWGVTANLMLKRSFIKKERFRDIFPKFGGGEDIDFCLRLINNKDHFIKTINNAIVLHPWWNGGTRQYKRFYRWASGDSKLPNLFPKYRYFNFPNIAEMLLLFFIISPIISYTSQNILYLLTPLTIWIGDISGEYLKLLITKKKFNLIISLESEVIRFSNDIGRLTSNIKILNFNGICERFDYFCNGKHIKSERLWAFSKFIFMISGALFFWLSI